MRNIILFFCPLLNYCDSKNEKFKKTGVVMIVEKLHYKNDKKQKIDCDFHYPENYDGKAKLETIMLGHGLGGSKESEYIKKSIRPIVDSGRLAVSYNVRGAHPVKPKTGDLTPQNMISDLKHVSEFVASHKSVDDKRIIAINASYTANGILEYAAQPNSVRFVGIVDHSTVVKPLTSFQRRLSMYGGLFLRAWEIWGSYPANIDGKICKLPYGVYKFFSQRDMMRDVAPNITCKVSFIHGTKDFLGPIDHVRELAAALVNSSRVELYEIQGAPHDMKNGALERAIKFSEQAVEIMYGNDYKDKQTPNKAWEYGRLVDVNGQPYITPSGNNDAPQMQVA